MTQQTIAWHTSDGHLHKTEAEAEAWEAYVRQERQLAEVGRRLLQEHGVQEGVVVEGMIRVRIDRPVFEMKHGVLTGRVRLKAGDDDWFRTDRDHVQLVVTLEELLANWRVVAEE